MDAYRRLAAAILLRAARDAQSNDPALASEARRWLAGPGASWAELALDMPHQQLTYWVERLPALPYEQLILFSNLQ